MTVQGEQWEERWGEHYRRKGQASKWADKWSHVGNQVRVSFVTLLRARPQQKRGSTQHQWLLLSLLQCLQQRAPMHLDDSLVHDLARQWQAIGWCLGMEQQRQQA